MGDFQSFVPDVTPRLPSGATCIELFTAQLNANLLLDHIFLPHYYFNLSCFPSLCSLPVLPFVQ